jgi:7-cyano-7-deazaguanine synthase
MKVILLSSGGLDSTTALYHLRSEGHEVKCLGIHYGQRHCKELEAAQTIADRAGVEYRLVDLSNVQPLLAGCSQTSDNIAVPEGHYTEESMKQTVVPNRNMIMLSIAMGWAVSLKYDAVAFAAHAGDHTIYPDCRPEFIEKMQEAGQLCDWHQVDLISPFAEWSKTQIVKRGIELDVPMDLTWSCYKGGEIHCGKCGTCTERREAFKLAAVTDPTRYE